MIQSVPTWQTKIFQQWQQFIAAKKIPHALLLHGPAGVGKWQLVKAMLAYLWCENRTDTACGKCRHCHWLSQDNHPDCEWLRPEAPGKAIKIDAIREACSWLQLSPLQRPHKVLVIQSAENLNLAASNALLKTLEEPPSSGLVILTSETPQQLLATVRSRCYQLVLPLPDEKISHAWFKAQAGIEVPKDFPAELGPYALLAEAEPEQTKIREQINSIFEQLLSQKISFMTAAEKLKEISSFEILRYAYFLMQVKIKQSHAENNLAKLKAWLGFESNWLELKRSLLQAANLNWQLQLELLLAEMVRINNETG